MHRRLPKNGSIILGTALLWLIYSEHGDGELYTIRHCVHLSYNNYRNPDFEQTNLIKRLPIIITGNKG